MLREEAEVIAEGCRLSSPLKGGYEIEQVRVDEVPGPAPGVKSFVVCAFFKGHDAPAVMGGGFECAWWLAAHGYPVPAELRGR